MGRPAATDAAYGVAAVGMIPFSLESDRVIAALVDVLGRMPTEEDDEAVRWFTLGWAAGTFERDDRGEPLARGRGSRPGDWALG